MNNMLRLTEPSHRHRAELSIEERAQLNAIIDILIPSDKDFPPPSSLHLIDEFLRYLSPTNKRRTTLMLSEKHLHIVLHELNISAGGNFCLAKSDVQQSLLKRLEQHEPAFFQALWTLVNHSYYSLLANNRYQAQLI
jgi:hypothetical protein